MKKTLLATALFMTLPSMASLVAVMDSGTDTGHVRLAVKAWENKNESIGNVDWDGDGLPGNKYGWDFTTNTSRFFEAKYAPFYTGDVQKFFDLIGKYDAGTVNAQEVQWLREKFNDQVLMSLVNFMGTYNHGTHVAGIASQGSSSIKVMPIKVLSAEPTEELPELNTAKSNYVTFNDTVQADETPVDGDYTEERFRDEVLNEAFMQVANAAEEVKSLKFHKVDVANQSYGMGYQMTAEFISSAYQSVFGKQMERAALIDLTNKFFQTMEENSHLVSKANDYTLFVIAAGNDTMNNDKYGAFPTNIKIANKISVAASNGYSAIADFSNFGENNVDVAAPGVGIISTAVNQQMMPMSGTSQAAPFVANVAARVKDVNPKLNALQIKKIIMETVDKKAWLVGKVKSQGVVNINRALKAAELSTFNNVEVAVALARGKVADMPVLKSFGFAPKAKIGKKLNFQPKIKFFGKLFK